MVNLKLTPYWWEAAPLENAKVLGVPNFADVCIIGAGFAGLSAALWLARAGRSVVILDSQRAGEGASSRNGGIASGTIKFTFNDMIKKFGLDHAKDIYAEGIVARDHLKSMISAEEINCSFKLTGRFTGANYRVDYDAQARETDVLNKHLGVDAKMISKADQHSELGTDFYIGGMVRPDIGGLHPGQFHQGLLARAQESGVTVICETPATRIAKTGKRFIVSTPRGGITARDIIIATNGYTGGLVPWLNRRVIPIPSQIIATENINPKLMDKLMPKRRMLGNTLNLYNYFRPSPDDKCIIFGGRKGANTDDPIKKTMGLRKQMVQIFPELEDVSINYSWWGYTGYTFDYLPKVTVHSGIHYALGFCGSGVVWANWLGLKAALAILGEQNSESVFAKYPFQTHPLYFGRPWFLPFVISWYDVKDKLKRMRYG
jgi:glycine/D-amino acid oxidase-like deaminating enzyme